MERYNGQKCVYCKEVFKAGDDVVVCPVCGAPYHRDCYKEMGECVNCKENGGKEYVFEENGENKGDILRCRFCGSVNDKSALFCSKCSRSLMDNDKSEPFSSGSENKAEDKNQGQAHGERGGYQSYNGSNQSNPNYMTYGGLDPEEEIEGCKVKDLAVAIGPSSPQYLVRFKAMAQKKSWVSPNLSSFIFTYFFFFYRKMYKEAIFYALLNNMASIPSLIVYMGTMMNFDVTDNMQTLALILSYVLLAARFVFTLFANKMYMEKCIKNIKDAKEKNLPESLCNEEIAKKGGVSIPALYAAAIVSVLFSVVISLIFIR